MKKSDTAFISLSSGDLVQIQILLKGRRDTLASIANIFEVNLQNLSENFLSKRKNLNVRDGDLFVVDTISLSEIKISAHRFLNDDSDGSIVQLNVFFRRLSDGKLVCASETLTEDMYRNFKSSGSGSSSIEVSDFFLESMSMKKC